MLQREREHSALNEELLALAISSQAIPKAPVLLRRVPMVHPVLFSRHQQVPLFDHHQD